MTEGPAPVGPQQFGTPKDLIAEAENLEFVQQRNVVDESEKRLIGKRCPKRNLLGAGNNPLDYSLPQEASFWGTSSQAYFSLHYPQQSSTVQVPGCPPFLLML